MARNTKQKMRLNDARKHASYRGIRLMKVMVTGDKGYIGSHLTKFLKDKGIEVVGYDAQNGMDINDHKTLSEKMTGCKVVFHCAAISGIEQCEKDPELALYVNVLGTQSVMKLARRKGVKPVLFSTFAVKQQSTTFYALSKAMIEGMFKKDAVIFRLSNVYGGDNFFKMKKTVIKRFMNDNPIIVYGGRQTREFVHISKILENCWYVIAGVLTNGVYDITNGLEVSIGALAYAFAHTRDVPVEVHPPREWEKK